MEIKLINVTSYSITQYACFSTGCEWDSSSLDRNCFGRLVRYKIVTVKDLTNQVTKNKAASIFE